MARAMEVLLGVQTRLINEQSPTMSRFKQVRVGTFISILVTRLFNAVFMLVMVAVAVVVFVVVFADLYCRCRCLFFLIYVSDSRQE